jgi:hypothetical protein
MKLRREEQQQRQILDVRPPICRRRWRNIAFRSASSDEDGGNPANIAASGASNRTQRERQPKNLSRASVSRSRRGEEERAEAFFLRE